MNSSTHAKLHLVVHSVLFSLVKLPVNSTFQGWLIKYIPLERALLFIPDILYFISSHQQQAKTLREFLLCSTLDVSCCFMLPAISQQSPQRFKWNSLLSFSFFFHSLYLARELKKLHSSGSTFHYSGSTQYWYRHPKQKLTLEAIISQDSGVSGWLVTLLISNYKETNRMRNWKSK